MAETVVPGLERRLKAHLLGEVNFDAFTRGRYATDASHYQVMPVGVVAPRSIKEAEHALALAREEGVSVLPRGAGTSQSGQTVNASLVIDCSRYLDHVLALDVRRPALHGRARHRARRAQSPAAVRTGCGFRSTSPPPRAPPSAAWSATIPAARARCATATPARTCSRSTRCWRTARMRISVRPRATSPTCRGSRRSFRSRASSSRIAAREADAIEANFPKVQRRVGGYNLDALVPGRNDLNLAHILVGSEGTLAFSTRIELKLAPLLGRRAVGACHFGSFMTAMDAAQHIVKLGPIAVELVDRTMLGLAREIAMFQPTIDAVVRGDPEAILFVEFAEDDQDENVRRLGRLNELMGDLGLSWDKTGAKWGGVIEVLDPAAADRHHRDAHRRPQHHDVDEGGGQTDLVRRGLRGAARASGGLYLAAHRHLREARHPRHLVCARLGRLPACAAGAQPAARARRQGDARDRRGSLRHGEGLQGLAFGRARRRHRALGIPRQDVRAGAGARVRGGQGELRSGRPLQSGQDRARA